VGYIFWRSANDNGSRNNFARKQAKEQSKKGNMEKEEEGKRERKRIARFNFLPSAIAPSLLNRQKYWSSF